MLARRWFNGEIFIWLEEAGSTSLAETNPETVALAKRLARSGP
ncbi:hypothetical protein [Rhodoblastus sp.]